MNSGEKMIESRKVTENNYVECMNLKVTVEDDSFVDSVFYSLAEAYVFYNESIVFAIYNNETLFVELVKSKV